ncbi:hypothetical protein [Echinicola sediminis]
MQGCTLLSCLRQAGLLYDKEAGLSHHIGLLVGKPALLTSGRVLPPLCPKQYGAG